MNRTRKLIERNKAACKINRLQKEGREVPLSLLAKVSWKRRIARGAV